MLTPFARRLISRIRCLNRSKAFGGMARLTSGPAVKLNPRNFRSCGPVGHQNAACEEKQAFACRMALSGDSVQLRSIDGYSRYSAGCIRPRLFRVSPQTRSGSGRTSAATRRVQAEADPSQTAQARSAVLDCAPPFVV